MYAIRNNVSWFNNMTTLNKQNSTAKSGQATKLVPKQQQINLTLAEQALVKITLNKHYINIINLNLWTLNTAEKVRKRGPKLTT